MSRRRAFAHQHLVLLAFVVAMSGCDCRQKTDEEILVERIDTTQVHLYLATKIAIVKADKSPEAKAARDSLLAALAAVDGSPAGAGRHQMTAADAVVLTKALYGLKKEGEELLASGDEKGLEPFLPLLFEPHDALREVLDLNMEHALLLTGMFVLKLDSRSPVPIPPEIMLYEAWMIDSSKLMPGMSGLLQAEKAIVYGSNELCDLSAHEAALAEKEADQAELFAKALGVMANKEAPVTTAQARRINAGVRAVAHGSSAYCYQQRGEDDKFIDELDKALDATEELGVPEGELALVRAYIAFQREDHAKAKAQLEIARDYKAVDPETKKDIEAILANLEDDPNVFEAKLGKAFFSLYLAKIILRALDKAGVFDELKNAEIVTTIDGFLGTLGGTLGAAKDAIPDQGLLDRVKAMLPGGGD